MMQALPQRALVLVAHPDDETVAFGALLQRMRDAVVVFATDAAPRDQFFWHKYGSRQTYAHVRQQEAAAALALAGVREFDFLAPIADQELHRHLDVACERTAAVLHRHNPDAILTLAYEGGHPDHDACSFVASLLGREWKLPVWEAPLYHRRDGHFFTQRFVSAATDETVIDVTPAELEVKRRMFAAYVSQYDTVSQFSPERELVRPQAHYDYSRPPHEGELNYESWQWPMRGWELCDQFMQMLNSREGTQRRRS